VRRPRVKAPAWAARLPRPRLTIRIRLTLLFAALFVVLAAVLVGTSYAFVAYATTPEAQAQERASALQNALQSQGYDVEVTPRDQPGQAPGAPAQNDPVGEVIKQIDAQVRQNVLDDLLSRSLLAFAISAVIAVGLAYWLAGRVLRPIDRVTKAANELSETTLDRRLTHTGPDDEFARLTASFNGMLARLEHAFTSRQRFASDASHELRTPLAVLQASADNALSAEAPSADASALASEVRDQVARADSLIASLLALSRADDVIHTREPLDLADVAANVVSELEPRATAAGVALDLEVEDAPVLADPILVERAVLNLVDNAIRYNAASDGWVAVRVGIRRGASVVEVENTGPEVDPAEVPALFERFRRGAQRSEVSGHGLGLPIVSRVAEVHGGTVNAIPRAGGGLIVHIVLPPATP